MSKTGFRALALVTDAYGGYGGIAQYNRDLLTALSGLERIEEIRVLTRIGDAALDAPPAKVLQDRAMPGKVRYALSAARYAMRRGTYSTILCGHINKMPLAAALSRVSGAQVWLHVHGVDAWDPPSPLIARAMSSCALVTSVSRHTRRRLLGWSEIDPARVRVLPNTVRPMFAPAQPQRDIRAQLGIPAAAKMLITVSRISHADHYKGHSKVIEALPAVLLSEPDAFYVIVGEGTAGASLQALAERLGVSQNVALVGRLDDETLLELYRSASLFIMPSLKEGFGIVFVEAAQCGLPVIAGKWDGSVDALADGHIGRLVDPNSAAQIVHSICDGLAGRIPRGDVAAQRFCFGNFAEHVAHLYDRFLH